MNETIRHQLNHRTIRFYEDRPVEEAIRQQVLEVMNHTATSNGLQAFTVISIQDKEIRAKIAQVCKQPYVETVPEFWLILVDTYRTSLIAKEKGYEGDNYVSMDFFFQSAADVYLAAQNATNAIESLGLGAVYFGSILNDPQAIIDLLNLPPLTFPLLGLGFGYPNDQPQLKPRMPLSFKFGQDAYPTYEKSLVNQLADYDAIMQTYYDTRDKNKRVDAYTDQVKTRMEVAPINRSRILQVLEDQGFDLCLHL